MVLVTGASGLLGLHLVRALSAAGEQVRALYHSRQPELPEGSRPERIEWISADLLDFTAMDLAFAGVRTVYHCAAVVSYDPRDRDWLMQVNVEGTAQLVNLCLHHQVDKLLHVSSVATLGDETFPVLIHEQSARNEEEPRSVYAQSKYRAEMEVWRGMAEGLQAVIINPSIMLGEGDWSRSSTHLFQLVHNEFPYYTLGSTGWVDVQDVVSAAIHLMNSPVSGERFILNGGNAPYREVFTLMARAFGKRPPHREAKPWMTALVWRWQYLKGMLSGKRVTISRETARSAMQQKGYSAAKLLRALPGFRFSPLEETILRVATKKNLLIG